LEREGVFRNMCFGGICRPERTKKFGVCLLTPPRRSNGERPAHNAHIHTLKWIIIRQLKEAGLGQKRRNKNTQRWPTRGTSQNKEKEDEKKTSYDVENNGIQNR
jgi:hypothetical protein